MLNTGISRLNDNIERAKHSAKGRGIFGYTRAAAEHPLVSEGILLNKKVAADPLALKRLKAHQKAKEHNHSIFDNSKEAPEQYLPISSKKNASLKKILSAEVFAQTKSLLEQISIEEHDIAESYKKYESGCHKALDDVYDILHNPHCAVNPYAGCIIEVLKAIDCKTPEELQEKEPLAYNRLCYQIYMERCKAHYHNDGEETIQGKSITDNAQRAEQSYNNFIRERRTDSGLEEKEEEKTESALPSIPHSKHHLTYQDWRKTSIAAKELYNIYVDDCAAYRQSLRSRWEIANGAHKSITHVLKYHAHEWNQSLCAEVIKYPEAAQVILGNRHTLEVKWKQFNLEKFRGPRRSINIWRRLSEGQKNKVHDTLKDLPDTRKLSLVEDILYMKDRKWDSVARLLREYDDKKFRSLLISDNDNGIPLRDGNYVSHEATMHFKP